MAFRALSASVNESALPGDKKPAGFKGQGARPGGPMTWDWYAVFVDSEGKQMSGGSVTVQWYGVEVSGPVDSPTYTTPTIGAPVTCDSLAINRKGFGAGLWPWCTVTASAPVVAAKVIEVTIASAADGTYTIDLVDGDSNPIATYPASGDNNEDIAIGLAASFSSPGLSAVASFIPGILLVSADTGGVDFEIELTSPADDMTQSTTTPFTPGAASVEIRTTPSAAVEIDATAITDALAAIDFEAAAADAITEACASAGSIRNVVRPDGGGATVTLVGGADAGGGAAYYEIVPTQGGKITLQHFTIQTDKPIRYALWSGSGVNLYGAIDLAESFELDVSPIPAQWSAGAGGFRSIKTNQQEPLMLRISDRTAEVKFHYFAFITDDN